jgi:hypothetical protein
MLCGKLCRHVQAALRSPAAMGYKGYNGHWVRVDKDHNQGRWKIKDQGTATAAAAEEDCPAFCSGASGIAGQAGGDGGVDDSGDVNEHDAALGETTPADHADVDEVSRRYKYSCIVCCESKQASALLLDNSMKECCSGLQLRCKECLGWDKSDREFNKLAKHMRTKYGYEKKGKERRPSQLAFKIIDKYFEGLMPDVSSATRRKLVLARLAAGPLAALQGLPEAEGWGF